MHNPKKGWLILLHDLHFLQKVFFFIKTLTSFLHQANHLILGFSHSEAACLFHYKIAVVTDDRGIPNLLYSLTHPVHHVRDT